jgi:hypothetical protein
MAAPMPLVTLSDLRAPSMIDSTKTYAQRAVIRMQLGQMPLAPQAPATPAEIGVMSSWIAAGMPSCSSPDAGSDDGGTSLEADPNLIPQDELFACSGAVSDAPTRIRRLNRWEWTRDVGGSVERSWTGFSYFDNPFDPSADEQYGTYSTDESLDDATVELFLPTVSGAGPNWAGPYTGSNRLQRLHDDATLQCMFNDPQPSAACVQHFLSEFLLHGVLFRPATSDELTHLQAFATMVLAQEPAPDGGSDARTHSITRISNAAWLTSGALFKTELGPDSDAGRITLTDWELAQELAYAIGARAPGATPTYVYPTYSAGVGGHYADIAGAAADGGIHDPAVIDALWRANTGGFDPTRFDLIQDYDSRRTSRRGQYWLPDGIAGFFREWLGYGNVATVFKAWPEQTSQFDDGGTDGYRGQLSSFNNLMSGYYGFESTMPQQMDDMIARVVVGDTDVLKNLLTTTDYFVPSNANPSNSPSAILYTGQVYNTTAAIADDQNARWLNLPATERSGVLTHPAWLGAHGNNFEDDPSAVHRGKWVRQNLLCGYIPPLSSVKVMAVVGPHAPDKNARARLTEATASSMCQACHQLMNPLGLPFEVYNHAGYVRIWDHAADGGHELPDGTTTLVNMPDPALNGDIHDAIELNQKLAASPYVKRCFVRQTFRYFMGRPENRTDACTLAQMEQAYDAHNGSFTSMMSALFTSDTFRTRRVPGAGE